MSTHVRIYTTSYCGFCRMAKHLLSAKGIAFEEIDVTGDRSTRDWLVRETGQLTVPQIFIGARSIGGFRELHMLERDGRLDALLAGEPG